MSRLTNSNKTFHAIVRLGLVALFFIAVIWSINARPGELEVFDIGSVIEATQPDGAEQISRIDVRPISASEFHVNLWYTPEVKAQVDEQPAVQPTRLNLQLMAISSRASNQQEQDRTAVIYDPDTDQVHNVSVGTQIGSFNVQRITSSSVELSDGKRVALLELDLLEPLP